MPHTAVVFFKSSHIFTKFQAMPFSIKTRIISILFFLKLALSQVTHYEDADRRKLSESELLHVY
jgi:hypothetical protein